MIINFIFPISVCEPRSYLQRRRAANESGRPPAARTEGRAGAEGLEGDIHGQRRQLGKTFDRQGVKSDKMAEVAKLWSLFPATVQYEKLPKCASLLEYLNIL